MGKAWALGLTGVVMAFLLGLLVGGWMNELAEDEAGGTSADDRENSQPAGDDVIGQSAQVTGLKEQNEKLSEQVAKLQAKLMVQGLAAGKKGDEEPPRRDKYTPMEWPDNTPEAFRPGEFERLFGKIAEESEAEVDIVGVHCDEPPCLMIRRVPKVEDEKGWGELIMELRDTPTWKEHFPEGIGHQGTHMQCGDGRTEHVQIIWFTPDEWDEHFVDDMLARRWIRVSDISDNWKCLPP